LFGYLGHPNKTEFNWAFLEKISAKTPNPELLQSIPDTILHWKLTETPKSESRSRFPAFSIFKRDYSPKLCRLFENDGFLKRRQKCKNSGTFKAPRAAITKNEPIQSKLDFRLDLAVSINMLV
jgi:hypothetical protein